MIEIPFAVQLPASMLAMAVKDATGALTSIAENRGRGVLAGMLDAGNDLGQVAVNVAGVGSVLLTGASARTGATLAAMMVTSFFGTIAWTEIGKKIRAEA